MLLIMQVCGRDTHTHKSVGSICEKLLLLPRWGLAALKTGPVYVETCGQTGPHVQPPPPPVEKVLLGKKDGIV